MSENGFVYFARAGNSSFVKIGFASDVERRMRELQTSNSSPVEALISIPGDRALEGRLHKRFAAHRKTGEWFRLSDEIKTFIRRNGGPTITLAAWRAQTATDDDVRDALKANANCLTRLSPPQTEGSR